MITLIQLINLLDSHGQLALKEFLFDREDGFTLEDVVDSIPDFMFAHWGIELQLNRRERDSIIRVVKNESALSAFSIIALKV